MELDEALHQRIRGSGLIHFDGKREVALDRNSGKVVIVDSFGNADEDRYVIKESYNKGHIVEMSKELFGRHYRDIGYYSTLLEARRAGEPDRHLPKLPREVVEIGTNTYIETYERLTGKRFNPDSHKELGWVARE
ncbi:MAG: hypothetical protein KGH64_00240 [Candidatus Micrarchaeota archaeon]|nr:hypothetical protein [Candidatus Micrarchaeota archaeon]MDE1833744.1 hypothetical protein [Candidatus Micrarchaeota archaeon]MDE1859431.1 hypothetical protein [Candidatus Micrarchaeota archaeon]